MSVTSSSQKLVLPLRVLSGVCLALPWGTGVAHAQAPISTASAFPGGAVPIQSVNDPLVTLGAGSNQGIAVGQTLPVFRGGSVVALIRVESVQPNTAAGTLVFTQGGTTLSTADLVTIAPSALATPGNPTPSGKTGTPGSGTGTPGSGAGAPGTGTPTSEAGVVVPFETGVSNESVPKADRTYELLATLAAQGLIRSQPARFFQEDGARRHRYAEDIVLSRAQIVGFINEALQNTSPSSSKGRAALSILTRDYRRDLLLLGVSATDLDDYAAGKPSVGISGFLRARVVGGDTGRNTIQPFDERFGAGRTTSGADVRLNAFATLSKDLNFYGSVDTGSNVQKGLGDQTTIRKAFLSYNASKILRGLTIDVGRKEFYWGVGTFGTGVLGDAEGGLNSISTRFERGSYRFDTMYADLGSGVNQQGRSLYGHNLSVRVGKQARVGLSETILQPQTRFSTRDFLGALSPLSLYLIDRPTSFNSVSSIANNTTNAVVSAYGETAVARGVRTYGEIVIDDIAINNRNGIENRDGSTFGVQLFNPHNPARAGFTGEYTRTNSLFYLQYGGTTRNPDYEYYYGGAPLGFPIVPSYPTTSGGAESLRFEGYYQPLPKLTLFGGLQLADINSEDQMTAVAGAGGFSRQQVLRFAASYDLTRNFALTARAQRVATDQPNFIKGEPPVTNSIFSLEIAHSF